jgi:integrase
LQKWYDRQDTELIISGLNHKGEKQLVFSSTKNGPIQISKPLHWLRRIQKKYELQEITVHGFRHTHCSLLL